MLFEEGVSIKVSIWSCRSKLHILGAGVGYVNGDFCENDYC